MTKDRLTNEYFEWMYNLVCNSDTSYRKLLCFLHSKKFYYTVPMDENRYADGIDLRYIFGNIRGYSQQMISSLLDNEECSVLEMMVALAYRCETEIMCESELGDRIYIWFWVMLDSLGLSHMDDIRFNKLRAFDIVDTFLNRAYQSNGKGGLFTLDNPPRDLRNVEIWYQLMWYLNELDEKENRHE